MPNTPLPTGTLDISIVFFALIVVMILMILGIGLRSWIFTFMSAAFGMASLGYFLTNYGSIVIGTFKIPFVLFDIAWVFLCIITPMLLIMQKKYGMR